jgi:hypothetical protein
LDYGWDEPLGEAMMKNYTKMATIAAQNRAVVIRGTSAHFEDEVFSWHHINGYNAENLLPAILITNRHPEKFRDRYLAYEKIEAEKNLKFILIPLRKCCTTTTDALVLVDKIFSDIQLQKDLDDFQVAKEMKRGVGRAVADALILEPNVAGIGVNIKKIFQYLSGC